MVYRGPLTSQACSRRRQMLSGFASAPPFHPAKSGRSPRANPSRPSASDFSRASASDFSCAPAASPPAPPRQKPRRPSPLRFHPLACPSALPSARSLCPSPLHVYLPVTLPFPPPLGNPLPLPPVARCSSTCTFEGQAGPDKAVAPE